MKHQIYLFLLFTILLLSSCFDNNNSCPEKSIGEELLTFNYFNEGTPSVTPSPTEKKGNITFEPAFATPVFNGVEIVIPGVRLRSESHNLEIVKFKVDERTGKEACFEFQNEFTNAQSSFRTKIASVLVLDMSTSLFNNIIQLKNYAKEYAKYVVYNSPNSTVAVVFFSDRDAIQVTQFYTSANINQLDQLIDNYSDYQERSALFQAVQTGIELLDNLTFEGEKSLVAFTDGGDNDSNNPSQLISKINTSKVEKFAIGLRGTDYKESSLRSIVSEPGSLKVAEDINSLQSIFCIISRSVISVYEIRYRRSDQLLSKSESVDIRLSFESKKIE
jgi:hypothetical protein